MIFQILRLVLLCLLVSLPAQANQQVTIATGDKDGMYHGLAVLIKQQLEQSSKVKVKLVTTEGSGENIERLKTNAKDAKQQVDFAIAQVGAANFDKLKVVTPLFIEPVMVFAPRKGSIKHINQVKSTDLLLGSERSGSRISAMRILSHYDIAQPKLSNNGEVQIIVTALLNPSIKHMVRQQDLQLLAIDDAAAIAVKHPHLQAVTVPAGIFSSKPRIPQHATATLATTAVLLARKDLAVEKIEWMLDAIYRSNLKADFPLLMTPDEVKSWSLFPHKPLSIDYLDPLSGLGLYVNLAESIAAIKEIIFALIAAGYFTYVGFKRRRERRAQGELNELKEQLDVFLEKTVALEREFMAGLGKAELQSLLQQVIDNKLAALEQLTDEKLRGDNLFAIFIAQSNNLVTRIEQKIAQ